MKSPKQKRKMNFSLSSSSSSSSAAAAAGTVSSCDHYSEPMELRVTSYSRTDEEQGDGTDADDKEGGCCSGCHRNRCCCCCCCVATHRPIGNQANRCSRIFLRLFLIIPNAFFVVAGFALAGLGIWIRMDRDSFVHLEMLRHLPTVAPLIALDRFPVVVISVGCSVAILSLMGCCGACAENVCCLCLYSVCLVLIIIGDVALVVVGFVMRDQMTASLGSAMQQQITIAYNTSSSPSALFDPETDGGDDRTFSVYFTRSWDTIQIQFDCCGSFGPRDYEWSNWFNRTRAAHANAFVPASCCRLLTRQDGQSSAAKMLSDCQKDAYGYIVQRTTPDQTDRRRTRLRTEGCHRFVVEETQRNMSVIIGCACAVVLLQIVCFVFACVLLRFVRKRHEQMWIDYADDSLT